jgi:hypothetical protein
MSTKMPPDWAEKVTKELVMPDHSSGELRRTGRILLIEAVGLNSVDLPE